MVRDTSIISYGDIKSTLGLRQRVILDIIRHMGTPTNLEISRYIGLPINTVTPRVFELKEKGLVYEVGKRTCLISGRMAYAWRVKCLN